MSTIEITTDNFADNLEKEGIFLVDVWAPWCGPCRAFGPIFEAASEAHPDITWGKLNSQDQPELASAFQIQAIPTLMAFRDGILLFKEAGMLPKQALEQLVTQLKAVDMDAVRKEVEAAKQKAKEEAAGLA